MCMYILVYIEYVGMDVYSVYLVFYFALCS